MHFIISFHTHQIVLTFVLLYFVMLYCSYVTFFVLKYINNTVDLLLFLSLLFVEYTHIIFRPVLSVTIGIDGLFIWKFYEM